jgi:multidrug efflux pump subunit AcrB
VTLVAWVRLAVARCKIIAVTGHRLFSATQQRRLPALLSEIRRPRPQFAGHHGQKGRAAGLFSHILAVCVHHRWITIAVTVAASALSLFGMNFVQQQFFPSSDHAELAIDWNLPQTNATKPKY